MRRPVVLPVTLLVAYVATAGLTWLGWDLAGESGTRAAVAVLLVATPLAVLAAQHLPVWLARRIGRDAGLSHLGAGALDAAARLDRLVIDTDRTITTGHLVVTQVQPLDPTDERTLRWFAGALAHRSEDPVNRAIARLAGNGRITGVAEDPELGIRGSVDRHPVRIGRVDWLDPSATSPQGATVGVEVDHRPLGHISVADEVRPDASQQLAALRRDGVHPVLVSGSAERDVARVADLAGAEEWHAGTDHFDLARRLGGAEARVGWAAVTAGVTSAEVELVLPGPEGEDTCVRAEDTSIGSLVLTLGLLRRTHAARRVALQVALVGIVTSTAIAAAGLLSPVAAACLGAAVLAAVVLTTVFRVTAARTPAAVAPPSAPAPVVRSQPRAEVDR